MWLFLWLKCVWKFSVWIIHIVMKLFQNGFNKSVVEPTCVYIETNSILIITSLIQKINKKNHLKSWTDFQGKFGLVIGALSDLCILKQNSTCIFSLPDFKSGPTVQGRFYKKGYFFRMSNIMALIREYVCSFIFIDFLLLLAITWPPLSIFNNILLL